MASIATVDGEFGPGAHGPLIRLVVNTKGVDLLAFVLRTLAESPDGESRRLDLEEGVRIRGLSRLDLRVVGRPPARHLVRDEADGFTWFGTRYEWETRALYLEPFLRGETGHQYLTNEQGNDADVEVSFGEFD